MVFLSRCSAGVRLDAVATSGRGRLISDERVPWPSPVGSLHPETDRAQEPASARADVPDRDVAGLVLLRELPHRTRREDRRRPAGSGPAALARAVHGSDAGRAEPDGARLARVPRAGADSG